jgi:hypothetical protein
MLVRLLYASRSAQTPTHDMMESILAQSRKHNPELGITGILCYGGSIFMQVVEGGRDAVNRLYRDIVRDEWQRGVVRLRYCEAPERRLSNWTYGTGRPREDQSLDAAQVLRETRA